MTDQEVIYSLLELGVIAKAPGKVFFTHGIELVVPERLKVVQEAEEEIYNAANQFLSQAATTVAEYQYKAAQEKIGQLPVDLQKEELGKFIKAVAYSQEESHRVGDKATRAMILESFSYKDYLDFKYGEYSFSQNEIIMGLKEHEASILLVQFLTNEYNRLSDNNGAAAVVTDMQLNEGDDNLSRITYTWLGFSGQISDLFKSLRKGELIDKSTNLKQFKAIFSSVPVSKVEPVKWYSHTSAEVLFLIDTLQEIGFVQGVNKNPRRMDYQKLRSCFVRPDGTQFSSNLKNIRARLTENLSIDKKTRLLKAIKEIL